MNKKTILWVDDEIHLLKSHIIFLEDKGYNLITANSGEDAIVICNKEKIDLILLDEMMTGLDGISTLKIIKNNHPFLPIIMVTKNEEEWLMNEAIGEQISNYLIKPVNPVQIQIACKNILDNKNISDEKNIKDFLNYYKSLQDLEYSKLTYKEWSIINNDLSDWFIKLETMENNSFYQMLLEQKINLNKQFFNFIKNNYLNWINQKIERPILSSDIFHNSLEPIIKKNKQLIFIIIDCLRLDQWKKISRYFEEKYLIEENYHFSILPTATPFARNSIFSGSLPLELKNDYPDIWKKMFIDKEFNKHEDILFEELLKKNGYSDKTFSYLKISDYDSGAKLLNKINDYKNTDILGIVVNFVDILGHSRSESKVLKELIPNESAYSQSIYNWFQNSWLKDCFNEFLDWNADIVITSDHGNTLVDKPTVVKADHTSSSGVRYKYGRNLNISDKNILKIDNPNIYRLPTLDVNTQYLIASSSNFFVYSNQYHKYINMFSGTFQHGGISLDEIIVPLIHLKKN